MAIFYIRKTPHDLMHHGVKGMKWGIRRYQNPDGSLTPEGLEKYGTAKEQRTRARRAATIGTLAYGPAGGIVGNLVGKLGTKDSFNKFMNIGKKAIAAEATAVFNAVVLPIIAGKVIKYAQSGKSFIKKNSSDLELIKIDPGVKAEYKWKYLPEADDIPDWVYTRYSDGISSLRKMPDIESASNVRKFIK